MPNSWRTVISYKEIWMAVHEGDMVRLDEFLYLYCLRESKRFGYYEFSPWEKKTRLVVDLPLSFRDWKS